jgi:hypothetical protein
MILRHGNRAALLTPALCKFPALKDIQKFRWMIFLKWGFSYSKMCK